MVAVILSWRNYLVDAKSDRGLRGMASLCTYSTALSHVDKLRELGTISRMTTTCALTQPRTMTHQAQYRYGYSIWEHEGPINKRVDPLASRRTTDKTRDNVVALVVTRLYMSVFMMSLLRSPKLVLRGV